MAGDNPVARINSQIFQSRDIKGCKLHFWSNAPGGCNRTTQFRPGWRRENERQRDGARGVGPGEGRGWPILSLVECENRDNRFINQIKSMIE